MDPPNKKSSRPRRFSLQALPLDQRVVGNIPPSVSDRNILDRGARSPFGPHQIRLSLSKAANPMGLRLQHRFGGGRNVAPLGEVTSKMFSDFPVFANWRPRAPPTRLIVIATDCQGPRGSLSGFENRSSCSSVRMNIFGLNLIQ